MNLTQHNARIKAQADKRRERLRKLRKKGLTYKEIGEREGGMSPQRVEQLCRTKT